MAERAPLLDQGGARPATVALDDFDRAIVALLTADARLSIRAIARELGRSPGAVGERLTRLEASGVITGYHADVDYARLGYMHTLLGMRLTEDELLEPCVEAVTALPEVQRVWVVTGSWAMVAEAQVRDAAHLRELLHVRMRAIRGVQHTEAMIVLETASTRPAAVAEPVPLNPRRGRPVSASLGEDAHVTEDGD
jgi:Lrp/AsnC family transcriptional regulator, leucine-responsive regulatory protein